MNLSHALQSYTLPKGNGMRFECYLNGKVFRHATFPLGEANTFPHDDLGRPTADLDADWHVVVKHYDLLDRVIQATDNAGQLRNIGYVEVDVVLGVPQRV